MSLGLNLSLIDCIVIILSFSLLQILLLLIFFRWLLLLILIFILLFLFFRRISIAIYFNLQVFLCWNSISWFFVIIFTAISFSWNTTTTTTTTFVRLMLLRRRLITDILLFYNLMFLHWLSKAKSFICLRYHFTFTLVFCLFFIFRFVVSCLVFLLILNITHFKL